MFAAAYIVFGATELTQGHRVMAVVNLVFAALWGLIFFPITLWMWRCRASQSKAEDGPGADRSPKIGG